MSEIKLGNFTLATPQSKAKRISLLLWGKSGVGKTTFAGSAPGPKLWINFDPDGADSLAHLDDVLVLDLSGQAVSVVEKFKDDDPFRIGKEILDANTVQTVVFDSTTTFGDACLRHGVVRAGATKQGRGSTLEQPGLAGYGHKNAWVNAAVTNLLRLTARYDKHLIVIAHEDKPDLTSEGAVSEISLMLGSSLKQQIPVPFSEIWYMSDNGKVREVYVRPYLYYRPMKTRMFAAEGKGAKFTWQYDLTAPTEGVTIAALYEQWVENSGKKIPLPK